MNPPGWRGRPRPLAENGELREEGPCRARVEHGQRHRGVRKILLQNSNTPSLSVLEERFFQRLSIRQNLAGVCVFFLNRNSKRHICDNSKFHL